MSCIPLTVMAAAFLLICESTFICALPGLRLRLMGEWCTSLEVCVVRKKHLINYQFHVFLYLKAMVLIYWARVTNDLCQSKLFWHCIRNHTTFTSVHSKVITISWHKEGKMTGYQGNGPYQHLGWYRCLKSKRHIKQLLHGWKKNQKSFIVVHCCHANEMINSKILTK